MRTCTLLIGNCLFYPKSTGLKIENASLFQPACADQRLSNNWLHMRRPGRHSHRPVPQRSAAQGGRLGWQAVRLACGERPDRCALPPPPTGSERTQGSSRHQWQNPCFCIHCIGKNNMGGRTGNEEAGAPPINVNALTTPDRPKGHPLQSLASAVRLLAAHALQSTPARRHTRQPAQLLARQPFLPAASKLRRSPHQCLLRHPTPNLPQPPCHLQTPRPLPHRCRPHKPPSGPCCWRCSRPLR